MHESSAYQLILDEGRIDALQKTLLRQGRRRFGPPTEAATTTVNGITDLERLERKTERLFDVSNWQELLDTP
jgi:hypothetical protein